MAGDLTKKGNTGVYWIIGIVVLVIIIIVIVIIKKKKQQKETEIDGNLQTPGSRSYGFPGSGNQNNSSGTSGTLKVGSKGDKVRILQKYLNDKHNAGLTVDGQFGSATKKAVEAAGISYPVTDQSLSKETGVPFSKIASGVVGATNMAAGGILNAVTFGAFDYLKNAFTKKA